MGFGEGLLVATMLGLALGWPGGFVKCEEVRTYEVHFRVRTAGDTHTTGRQQLLDGKLSWIHPQSNAREHLEPGFRVSGRSSFRRSCFLTRCLEITVTGLADNAQPKAFRSHSCLDKRVRIQASVDGSFNSFVHCDLLQGLSKTHRFSTEASIGETASFVVHKDKNGDADAWLEITVESASTSRHLRVADLPPVASKPEEPPWEFPIPKSWSEKDEGFYFDTGKFYPLAGHPKGKDPSWNFPSPPMWHGEGCRTGEPGAVRAMAKRPPTVPVRLILHKDAWSRAHTDCDLEAGKSKSLCVLPSRLLPGMWSGPLPDESLTDETLIQATLTELGPRAPHTLAARSGGSEREWKLAVVVDCVLPEGQDSALKPARRATFRQEVIVRRGEPAKLVLHQGEGDEPAVWLEVCVWGEETASDFDSRMGADSTDGPPTGVVNVGCFAPDQPEGRACPPGKPHWQSIFPCSASPPRAAVIRRGFNGQSALPACCDRFISPLISVP